MLQPITKAIINGTSTLFRSSGNCFNDRILKRVTTANYSSLIDKGCGKEEETCVERENPCDIQVKLSKGRKRVKPQPCPPKEGRWTPPCEIYMQEDQPYRPHSHKRFIHDCCPPDESVQPQPCDPCDDSANQKQTKESKKLLEKLKKKKK